MAFEGDPVRGEKLYRSKCVACHSLDRNRVGPKHRGVFERQAGTAEGYDYSRALPDSRLAWTAENLDAWLTNPNGLIPGQRMGFRMTKADDRQDIIAYLKQESEKQP